MRWYWDVPRDLFEGKKSIYETLVKVGEWEKKSPRAGLGAGQDHLGKHRPDVTNPDFELQIGEEGAGRVPLFPAKKTLLVTIISRRVTWTWTSNGSRWMHAHLVRANKSRTYADVSSKFQDLAAWEMCKMCPTSHLTDQKLRSQESSNPQCDRGSELKTSQKEVHQSKNTSAC